MEFKISLRKVASFSLGLVAFATILLTGCLSGGGGGSTGSTASTPLSTSVLGTWKWMTQTPKGGTSTDVSSAGITMSIDASTFTWILPTVTNTTLFGKAYAACTETDSYTLNGNALTETVTSISASGSLCGPVGAITSSIISVNGSTMTITDSSGNVSTYSLQSTSSSTPILNYSSFSGVSGLTFKGSANDTSVPGQLQLTSASSYATGAVYSTSPITLGTGYTFSTQFQFQITNSGGLGPADGIVFVLAASPTGLGSPGAGLGYGGVGNSVGIEFDTYNNGTYDGNSSNHVAINENGHFADNTAFSEQALSNVYGISSCGFNAGAGCMSNGQIWTVNITYDGTNLNVSLSDPSKGTTFNAITNYPINIGSFLGTNTAYVGFTAATGGGYENHNIVSWQFSN